MKLYHLVSKSYERKGDVLALASILRGVYPFKIDRRGSRWVFTAIVADVDYPFLAKCL